MCHLLLLMPIFGLAVFWFWLISIAASVYRVILGLSGWLYYCVIKAMRRPVETGAEAILQSTVEVVGRESSLVRVRVRSEMWNAESRDDLHTGDRVEVTGIHGLTLVVRWINETMP